MVDCATIVRGLTNSPHLDACLAATAARRAGAIQAHAAVEYGYLTLGAGVLAFAGAALAGIVAWKSGIRVLENGDRDRRNARNLGILERGLAIRKMARVYAAEITALWDFF